VVDDAGEDLVLFAGGSGITPVISILKTALASGRGRVRLLYANRDEASIIFRAELEALASANPGRLEVAHRLDVREGFLDEAAVREAAKGREGASFFICGPGPFMDTVEKGLGALGVAPERIHIERFTSSTVDEVDDASATSGSMRSVDLVLDGARHALEVREGETVLHAARRSGLEPPFSCESGFCGCCMARLVRGRVRMIQNDFLSAAEVEEGWVLTCQAVPETDDVAVEFPD
jgi:3-ketosteroid 9alpha-monooxygenase subunit B